MKKILLLVLVLLIAGTSVSFAKGLAIGGAFGIPGIGNLPQTALLSFKLPEIPFILGVGMVLNQADFTLGVTADWWLYQTHLVGILNLYVGPGLYLTAPDPLNFGVRVPVGLQIWPIDPLELFVEIAPTVAIIDASGVQIPNFGVQGAFGFRFWF